MLLLLGAPVHPHPHRPTHTSHSHTHSVSSSPSECLTPHAPLHPTAPNMHTPAAADTTQTCLTQQQVLHRQASTANATPRFRGSRRSTARFPSSTHAHLLPGEAQVAMPVGSQRPAILQLSYGALHVHPFPPERPGMHQAGRLAGRRGPSIRPARLCMHAAAARRHSAEARPPCCTCSARSHRGAARPNTVANCSKLLRALPAPLPSWSPLCTHPGPTPTPPTAAEPCPASSSGAMPWMAAVEVLP